MPADGEDDALWRMVHDDGDEEDLEEAEVIAATRAFNLDLEEPPEGESMEEEAVEEEGEEGEEGAGMRDEMPAGGEAEVEVLLGRRWAKGGGRVVEFLVKWKGRSHLHVEWKSGSSLAAKSEKVRPSLPTMATLLRPLYYDGHSTTMATLLPPDRNSTAWPI